MNVGIAAMVPVLTVFAAFSSSPATAQETTPAQSKQWIVTLGGTAEYGPSYEGSKHYSFSGMPSFDIRRMGEPAGYSAPDDNIDYSLLDMDGFEAGPVAGLRSGRSAFDDHDLEGLRRVHWTIDAGAFAQYWPVEDRLRLRGEMRQALWDGDGLAADFAVDWFQPVSEDVVISAGPRMSFGNSTFMQKNFGVSQGEAASNGRVSAFDADGGLKSVGLMVAATYTISPAWSVIAYDRFDRLTGDAANSPITSQFGSENQNILGLTINRSFAVGF
ncbi:MAG: MipA/OmpV family protein [Rhizobiaceae bacterium]|nr:MipA/OmpV family protein [Rhizobiaceae bacterium]